MTDSTEAVPEIIRDLLHPTTELRRKALAELKENWRKEFREYLWVAIEEEKTRSLQSQFVELAVDKLEDHGLRKMIRYVESGRLYDGSRRIFIEAYCRYEDELVREALIKSLKRPKSQTFEFVGKLLTSREFVNEFGESWIQFQAGTNRLEHQQKFFNEITAPAIPIHARREFVAVAFWMNLKDKKYYLNLMWLWRNHIKTDAEIHRHILGLFFPNDVIKLDRTANITNISDVELLWRNWSALKPLFVTEAEDNLLISSHQVIQLSMIAVHSSNAADPRVRELAMNILSKQQLDLQEFLSFEDQQHMIRFMTAWDQVFNENLEDYLLEYFLKQSYLPQDFIQYAVEEGKQDQIRSICAAHNISHFDLAEVILLNKPRQVLFRLLDNDPEESNRLSAYSYLRSQKLWTTIYPLGPISLWVATLRKSVRSLRFEESSQLQSQAKELIYFLVDNLEYHHAHGDYVDFVQSIKTILSDPNRSTFMSELKALQDQDSVKPVILKLRNFLFDEPLVIDETLSISVEDQLLNQVLAGIEDSTNLFSIINLFNAADDETRLHIINYYYTRLEEDPDFALNKIMERHLQLLLEQARDDSFIRVRTTAQLLASNGGIDLLPSLLRELNTENIQNLIELVSLGYASTNQMIFQALASRLRRLRSFEHSDLLESLIRLGYEDDDMQTQKLAAQCAKAAQISL